MQLYLVKCTHFDSGAPPATLSVLQWLHFTLTLKGPITEMAAMVMLLFAFAFSGKKAEESTPNAA